MHEAGLVESALEAALREAPATGAVELLVSDPGRVAPDAARLHLALALAARGLDGLPVAVRVEPVRCVACTARLVPPAPTRFCPACGWPLPRLAGPGLTVRVVG